MMNKINIAIDQSQIDDEDIDALLVIQSEKAYCDNIVAIVADNNTPLYIFEDATLETIITIFDQAEYLEMVLNDDELKNTGEPLDIKFLFIIHITSEGWVV